MEVQKDIKDEKSKLESLSTIQKILILQNLLKEMSSMKGIFNDTKNKMLQKLDNNCYTFFKNKLYMKEIFEYCLSHKPEEQKDYELIENSKIYLKQLYQPLSDFYFLIRNENSLMLKIIELSDPLTYSELSDFFVHFLYGNILKNSFEEDELMIIIYLLLEKLILKDFPDNINEKNKNFPIDYLNNTFLFYVFKALTRKIDMRNFLYNILNGIILRLESYRMALSVDISIVNRFLKNRDRKQFHSLIKNAGSLKKEEVHRKKKNFKKMNKNIGYLKTNTGGNIFLKRANKIVLGDSFRANNNTGELTSLNDKLTQAYSLAIDNKSAKGNLDEEANKRKFEKRKTDAKIDDKNNNKKTFESKKSGLDVSLTNSLANSLLNKIKEEENENQDSTLNLKGKTKLVRKDKNKHNEEGKPQPEIEIGKFFEENSITIKALKDQLSQYKSKKDNSSINSAMNEYLNILIKQIESGDLDKDKDDNKNQLKNQSSKDQYFENNKEDNKDNKDDKEIYSTSLIVEELNSILIIKNKDSFINLIYKIRFNHRIVTKIILEIIKKTKDNLISSPYSLKCISKLIHTLLNIKYSKKSKNKLSYYNLYMFEINFLIGNIILPIILNPEFNGVVTTDVISEMTNDNLKILASILEKMIKGSLFNKKKDPYMTIYNKFIIETMPQLFELVEIIENHFEIPDNIKTLVDSCGSDLSKRNINYDYFKENPNENINYQDICFSWQNLYLLLQIVSKYKQIFVDENKNAEQKAILKNFLEHENDYIKRFMDTIKNKKFEFIYLTKDFYRDEFDKTIASITKDNFVSIIPKSHDDLITAFKKCLVEMLNYVNKIEIENFYELTEKKDEKTFKPKKYKKQKSETIKNNNLIFKGFLGSLTKSLLKLSIADKSEDADFRKVLFPQIRDNIVLEMNYNTDNDICQRIIFCTNYLNLYFRNIPKQYKENNYSLLFDELIKETKKNMEYLKTNVIFEYYKKLKDAEKLNMIIDNFISQIKNLKKLKCIEYLYNKLLLPIKFKINKDKRNIIYNIEYEKESKTNTNSNDINVLDYLKRKSQPIRNMIEEFPDFHDYEDEYDNILDIEEQSNTQTAINDYFESMRNLAKTEKILQKYTKDEKTDILNDLENYILTQLYDKLFPFESTKSDVFFYNKCCRISFIKPENIVKDKKIINENLWKQAIDYIEDMNDKLTPSDKIKCFMKAVNIIENSINFSSGKDNLGIDDSLQVLIYVVIKSCPTNIISNSQYCEMYLNSELSKSELGIKYSTLCMVINAIKDMKYSDLIGVSEEQFGKDEIEKEDNENENENEDKKE